jgi:hypothetical protein
VNDAEYERTLLAAEKAFAEAETAEEIRRAWKAYFPTLGHRTLGRLLVGRPGAELLSRREGRAVRQE